MPTTLVTIGTGTVVPSGERGSPSHWLESGPVKMLMDCGAGTIHRLARFGLPWPDLTHVAITHFHHDHIGELPALFYAFKYGQMEPRREPLVLLGPIGFRAKLAAMAAAFGDWVTAPGFPLEVVEQAPGPERALVRGITVDVCRTAHTEESLAFAVTTPDGRLVYTGDTGPSEGLGAWARGCDLLLAECSLPESMALAEHLTPRQAAELARDADAKRLVLTHLYPPVEPVDLGAMAAVYQRPVVVARDGDRFEL
jgi:ribonuclease BN (tRNA processing enzyme)